MPESDIDEIKNMFQELRLAVIKAVNRPDDDNQWTNLYNLLKQLDCAEFFVRRL